MCMVSNTSLAQLDVLVTRPKHQSDELEKMITALGGQVQLFPVIEVRPILIDAHWQHDLPQQDIVIFISKNAVLELLDHVNVRLFDTVKVATVGVGTAAILKQYGIETDIYPHEQAGSESLLALTEMQNVQGKKITIVRGHGGRELLASSLRERGAVVQYIEAYERVIARPSAQQLENALRANCSVCTSVSGVENLVKLLEKYDDGLLNKPLIVVSERIEQAAKQLGFKIILVTPDISDAEIVTTLIEMEL
jgi:uroporphyrinogen-III synthase